MTSLERTLIVAAVLLAGTHAASAEGTFFKKKRAATPAAATASASAPSPATAPPAKAVATAPVQPTPPQPSVPSRQTVAGNIDEVVSFDTLVVAGQRVRLLGVQSDGGDTTGLVRWLQGNGNRLTCEPQGDRYRCSNPRGADVSQIVLFNGAARTDVTAPAEYRNIEAQARAAGKGIWAQR